MSDQNFARERLVPALILFPINIIWIGLVSTVLLSAIFGIIAALAGTPFPFDTLWSIVPVLSIAVAFIGFLKELE